MRAFIPSLVAGLIAGCLVAPAMAQATDDGRLEAFIKAAASGDCTGYPAMVDLALSGRLDRFLSARLSAEVAICAAQDGRFDRTDQLIARAALPPEVGTEMQMRFVFHRLIRRLTDIPGAGASAQRAADAMIGLGHFPDRSIQSAELGVMADFAAGQNDTGLDRLKQIDRRAALSIQIDRRFAPAWLPTEQLIATLDHISIQPTSSLDDNWTSELAALDRQREGEASILATARRNMAADIANTCQPGAFACLAAGKDGSNGDAQRAWLVQRLLDDGQVDEALATLDLPAVRAADRSSDVLFVPGFVGVLEGLIRADQAEEAKRLVGWWSAVQSASKVEYVGMSRDENANLWPIMAIGSCLEGDHTARLGPSEWRLSLACADPQDRTAQLLLRALDSPNSRSEALQALNLPPRHPSLGKADDDYRRRWDALLARSDVAAAIEYRGRRLPAELAWRLARVYPAF